VHLLEVLKSLASVYQCPHHPFRAKACSDRLHEHTSARRQPKCGVVDILQSWATSHTCSTCRDYHSRTADPDYDGLLRLMKLINSAGSIYSSKRQIPTSHNRWAICKHVLWIPMQSASALHFQPRNEIWSCHFYSGIVDVTVIVWQWALYYRFLEFCRALR